MGDESDDHGDDHDVDMGWQWLGGPLVLTAKTIDSDKGHETENINHPCSFFFFFLNILFYVVFLN